MAVRASSAGAELAVRCFSIPQYILPTPSAIGKALCHSNFRDLFWPHMQVTLIELLSGFAIGASIGLILAAVITQFPFVEKIITPYILLLVTTPMIALVPLLMLASASAATPRIIAVALAIGPDGDDQRRHRLPPHRSRQDRARPLVRRDARSRSSPRSAFRWRCR